MNTTTTHQELNVNKAIAVFFAAVTLVSVIVCIITKATA